MRGINECLRKSLLLPEKNKKQVSSHLNPPSMLLPKRKLEKSHGETHGQELPSIREKMFTVIGEEKRRLFFLIEINKDKAETGKKNLSQVSHADMLAPNISISEGVRTRQFNVDEE